MRRDDDLAIEVHIQFPPYPAAADLAGQMQHRRRMSLALIEGLRWLERRVNGHGLREIHFDSRNPSLIRFAQKYLGFHNERGLLSKPLEDSGHVNDARIH